MWESNVIRDGISRTYEERGGAKSRVKSTEELLLFPDLFPRFSRVFEYPNRGKFAHTPTLHTSAKRYKFCGTDGKPTVDPRRPFYLKPYWNTIVEPSFSVIVYTYVWFASKFAVLMFKDPAMIWVR